MSSSTIDGIVQTSFEFGRLMRQKMMSHQKGDLHMAQLHVLALAAENAGVTMSAIAEYLHVSSPTATNIVGRLVRLGLLRRKHDTKNRTLVRLDLTAKGSKILQKKMNQKKKFIADVLSILSDSDRVNLLHILTSLLSNLQRS